MSAAESKLWYLERINLFKDLSQDELEEVDRVSQMKTMPKGQYIYFPEEPSKVIFLLKEGRVKLGSYSDDGKEIIKAILEPGEVFGELGIVGQEKRRDFAQAMDSSVRICAIGVSEMLRLMGGNSKLSLEMTKQIGDRLQRVERRLESLIFKDAKERIIDFIKTKAQEKGTRVGYEWLLKHNLTHQDIANLTATSRQTVTIVLNELREKDLIHFDRKSILIRDLDAI